MDTDYSVYLVTDSTMVPETSTFLAQVEQAVENGATIVQLREKDLSTLEFVQRARQVLEITKKKGVPLVINDRVDVALAVGADGVHVGQDDMPAGVVRRLIGPDKHLGVSCANEHETARVCEENVADYVGLGTLYPTNTKKVKRVCGPVGVRRLLEVLAAHNRGRDRPIRCVGIGGINHSNAAKVMAQCKVGDAKLDGVAIVSCIMAAADAAAATRKLCEAISGHLPWIWTAQAEHVDRFRQKPLVHHITNNVVKNFSANVTLAVGGSPIMSELASEFNEFAALPLPVSLVVNLGTPNAVLMEVFLAAIASYNKTGVPIIFDPVAAGASQSRLDASRTLLNAGQFSVIKGNVGEIMALDKLTNKDASDELAMQGVDSIAQMDKAAITKLGAKVSAEYDAVVVITGAVNYIFSSSGSCARTEAVNGGHRLMGLITGSGCSLGSVIGCFIACARVQECDLFTAVVDAVKLYNDAGRAAAEGCEGPGSFSARFLDALAQRAMS